MDHRLLDATMSGDLNTLKQIVMEDPMLLLGKTPQGNTALHLSVNSGRVDFTRELCASSPLLALAMVNHAGETPLHCAATSGHLQIARLLIERVKSSPALQKWDDRTGKFIDYPILRMTKGSGDTAVLEALRNCHIDVANELWNADPSISRLVNKHGESLLYFAVLRKVREMVNHMLENPSTPAKGPAGDTALHAAVAVGDLETAKVLLKTINWLIREPNSYGNTPLHYVALMDKLDFVQLLVGGGASPYVLNSDGFSPVHIAAGLGHVRILRELIRRHSDAVSILTGPRRNANLAGLSRNAVGTPSGSSQMALQQGNVPDESPRNDTATATLNMNASSPANSEQLFSEVGKNLLHIAIDCGKLEVIEHILKEPEFRGIINHPDGDGNYPLHLAALKCDPKIVRVLLKDGRTRRDALNRRGETALQLFTSYVEPTVTIQWNETLLLLTEAIPNDSSLLKRNDAQTKLMEKVSEEIRSLARAYANNTTIVSVLMATVTFAAAFSVPGGYISDSGSHPGQPILLHKATFKVFLITNTIALCTSLAVSFLYISASKGDVEFFLYYREFTRWLMWIAFITMALAFASGMYTVVAPGSLWLAILVCALCGCLPCLTGLMHSWPGSINIHVRPQKRNPLELTQML